MIKELSPLEVRELLKAKPDAKLIDVREEWERQVANIEGSILMPLQYLVAHAKEIDPTDDIVIFCHHGIRSAEACKFLSRLGYQNVYNLQGGIDAWSHQVDENIPIY